MEASAMSRRDWLKATAAATLGLAGLGPRAQAHAGFADEWVEVEVITGYGPCGEVVTERAWVRRVGREVSPIGLSRTSP